MEFLKDLIQLKRDSAELVELDENQDRKYRTHWPRLEEMLSESLNDSSLPEDPQNLDECNNWLLSVRIKYLEK